MVKRRWYTVPEIEMLRHYAREGLSQSRAATITGRTPGSIGTAAKRYNIQFKADNGRPRSRTPQETRQRKAANNRRYRQARKDRSCSAQIDHS